MKIRSLLAALLALFVAAPLCAQATYTQTQTGPFDIPAGAPGVTNGPASTYPITFTFSGITQPVTNVSVTLTGLTHGFPRDLDVLLQGPTGANVLLMSDVAGGSPGVTLVNYTFDQNAATALPTTTSPSSGTYRPANSGTGDTFPGSAPTGPYGNTLAAFNGVNPNGVWSLFIVDDLPDDFGSLQSATLSIATAPEPASWAMMIGGFGFIGGAVRRRRDTVWRVKVA